MSFVLLFRWTGLMRTPINSTHTHTHTCSHLPIPSPALCIMNLYKFDILMWNSGTWYLNFFPHFSEFEHLFIYLLAVWVFPYRGCLSIILSPFFSISPPSLLIFRKPLYSLNNNALLLFSGLIIFVYFVHWFFSCY